MLQEVISGLDSGLLNPRDRIKIGSAVPEVMG
jgi:hypothetical protein